MIPEFTDEASFQDLLEPAMEIAHRGDKAEAREFTRHYADYLRRRNPDWDVERAYQAARDNLGYYAGYYDYATRVAVFSTFGAMHPYFGMEVPSSREAFALGQKVGEAWRKGHYRPLYPEGHDHDHDDDERDGEPGGS